MQRTAEAHGKNMQLVALAQTLKLAYTDSQQQYAISLAHELALAVIPVEVLPAGSSCITPCAPSVRKVTELPVVQSFKRLQVTDAYAHVCAEACESNVSSSQHAAQLYSSAVSNVAVM